MNNLQASKLAASKAYDSLLLPLKLSPIITIGISMLMMIGIFATDLATGSVMQLHMLYLFPLAGLALSLDISKVFGFGLLPAVVFQSLTLASDKTGTLFFTADIGIAILAGFLTIILCRKAKLAATFGAEVAAKEQEKVDAQSREQLLRTLIDTIVDGVVLIDAKGSIQMVNPSTLDLFGYSPEELHGQNVKILMPESYAMHHDGYLHNYLTSGTKKIIGLGRDVVGQRKNGSTFPLALTVGEMQIDGRSMFVGILHDITARKNIEQTLVAAREEADRANQAKSEFLSSMSHELRTPLNAILGFSQLLVNSAQVQPDDKEDVREIERAGKTLLKLIDEVLQLSRIEAGKLELTLETVDVRSVISQCLKLVSHTAKAAGIQLLEGDDDGNRVQIQADPLRLQQIILNFLTNAIKYNRPMGLVRLTQAVHQNALRIAVTDTGLGIPGNSQSRVFGAFDRLGRENTSVEGTGIGLAITKRITEAMGGKLGFESKEGKGSTFWVEFPIIDRVEAALPSTEAVADDPAEPITDPGSKKTILYIEDDASSQRLMQRLLSERKNWQLLLASSAEDGILIAQTEQPAVILMDMDLPGMSGYEALRILRSDSKTASILVVALTSQPYIEDAASKGTAGFAAYLMKPFDTGFLMNTLGQLVAGEAAIQISFS